MKVAICSHQADIFFTYDLDLEFEGHDQNKLEINVMGTILWGHLSRISCNSLEKIYCNVVLCISVKDCNECDVKVYC